MSIVTRTGDAGMTGLMFNRRVSKCHPRVEAYGSVDELNGALGMARALGGHTEVREKLLMIQKDLVVLMGELACLPEDLDRYAREGYPLMAASHTAQLDRVVERLEAEQAPAKGWAVPGASSAAGALDLARAVCRRAERRVCALQESGQLNNSEIIVYLNRLSDTLWLMARWVEAQTGQRPAPPPD